MFKNSARSVFRAYTNIQPRFYSGAVSSFYMPNINIIGKDAVSHMPSHITNLKMKKPLIVTDGPLVKAGVVGMVTKVLDEQGVSYTIFDGVQPNPTVNNVNAGLKLMQENGCDSIISVGGGSSHDCAKGIGIVARNGGKIEDYEGVDASKNKMCPTIAVNTTSGTASEMTRFCIITDESKKVKLCIVDKNVTPDVSLNDTNIMMKMPKSLTAYTGMDALTHSVEAFVSTAATPTTNASALMAIELIAKYLPRAVANGEDFEARDNMTHAQFLAGMAFNNASLGLVHAISHQLGGFYDLPHGLCNGLLLPFVCMYNKNAKKAEFARIARVMGVNTDGMSEDDAADAGINKIVQLGKSVGVPTTLKAMPIIKESDFETLAKNALKDACEATNPVRNNTVEDVVGILKHAWKGL